MKCGPTFIYTGSALWTYIVVLVISYSTLWLFNSSPAYIIRVCVCVCVCVLQLAELSHCLSSWGVSIIMQESSSERFWNCLLNPLCLGKNGKLKAIEHFRRNSVAKISATLRPSLDSRMFPTIPLSSPLWLLKRTDEAWQMTVDYCKLRQIALPISAAR